jgi:hypothetical protein
MDLFGDQTKLVEATGQVTITDWTKAISCQVKSTNQAKARPPESLSFDAANLDLTRRPSTTEPKSSSDRVQPTPPHNHKWTTQLIYFAIVIPQLGLGRYCSSVL